MILTSHWIHFPLKEFHFRKTCFKFIHVYYIERCKIQWVNLISRTVVTPPGKNKESTKGGSIQDYGRRLSIPDILNTFLTPDPYQSVPGLRGYRRSFMHLEGKQDKEERTKVEVGETCSLFKPVTEVQPPPRDGTSIPADEYRKKTNSIVSTFGGSRPSVNRGNETPWCAPRETPNGGTGGVGGPFVSQI